MEHAKKPYRSPSLVEYGRMEQLTRGPWGGSFDSILGKVIGISGVTGGWNPFDPTNGRSR